MLAHENVRPKHRKQPFPPPSSLPLSLPPATPASVSVCYPPPPPPSPLHLFLIRHWQSMGNAVARKLFAFLSTLLPSRPSLWRASYQFPNTRVQAKNGLCKVGMAFNRYLSLCRDPTPLYTLLGPPPPALVTEHCCRERRPPRGTHLEQFAGPLPSKPKSTGESGEASALCFWSRPGT